MRRGRPCGMITWLVSGCCRVFTLCKTAHCIAYYPEAAPTAHKQSQFYCVKQSQLCCVDNHEQPRRGVSLFASTEQPVYRLEPPSEEGEPRGRWTPSLRVKRGLG